MIPRCFLKVLILLILFPPIVFAEDFKTVNGKEYKNVTVSRVEPDGIVLKTKSGVTKVYFNELPKEVQERFHYDPAQAAVQRGTAGDIYTAKCSDSTAATTARTTTASRGEEKRADRSGGGK